MADDVTRPDGVTRASTIVVPAQDDHSEEAPLVRPDRRERARLTSYRLRFALVYLLLALVLGASAGTFVVLLSRPDLAPAPQWSSWQPEGSRIARVRQIADRIPRAYLLASGNAIDVARASELSVRTADSGDVPVDAIYVRPDTSRGQAEENDIAAYDGSKTISYGLCGLGTNCSIAEGTPSAERFTVLRRQALELALYTFRYVDDVDSVIVFMPPTPKGQPNGAVFLRREQLRAELGRPLRRTLPTEFPTVGSISDRELASVVRLTETSIFAFAFQAGPDGKPVLVLQPPTASG